MNMGDFVGRMVFRSHGNEPRDSLGGSQKGWFTKPPQASFFSKNTCFHAATTNQLFLKCLTLTVIQLLLQLLLQLLPGMSSSQKSRNKTRRPACWSAVRFFEGNHQLDGFWESWE